MLLFYFLGNRYVQYIITEEKVFLFQDKMKKRGTEPENKPCNYWEWMKKMNECKNCKYLATFLEDVKEKKKSQIKNVSFSFSNVQTL